jgi:hypothetical protein
MPMTKNFATALEEVYPQRNCHTMARELARLLHREYAIAGPPFSPFKFAEKMGVPVRHADIEAEAVLANFDPVKMSTFAFSRESAADEDRSAHTCPSDSSIVGIYSGRPAEIILRQRRRGGTSKFRENFTLAHELGHFVLRKELVVFIKSGEVVLRPDDEEEEALCNSFAGELLMPREAIVKDLSSYGISPNAIMYLHRRYQVSLQAFLSRIERLFRGGIATAIWIMPSATEDPRIEWCLRPEFRRAIPCFTGKTPLEVAFRRNAQVTGTLDMLVNGNRSRWRIVALRLPDSKPAKVVSVLYRRLEDLTRYTTLPADWVTRSFERQMHLLLEDGLRLRDILRWLDEAPEVQSHRALARQTRNWSGIPRKRPVSVAAASGNRCNGAA